MKNAYDIFFNLTKKCSIENISNKLSLNKSTVERWNETKFVPFQYYFELCEMSDIEIDYKLFSEREKDQFFTSKDTAQYCFDKTNEILEDLSQYTFIEPSAGEGSFYNILPSDRRVGIDIEPKCDGVIQGNFLKWYPDTEKNICVGNPPFGMRGHLALKFINHAAYFCDYVCFILPQLFESDGKGSCKKRVKGMSLIHSETIDSNFYYPSGHTTKVNVVFQVWSKNHSSNNIEPSSNKFMKLYSLSDGGTPATTRNKKHLYDCDYYLMSTCFGKDKMKLYNSFEDLPQRRGYGIKILSHKEEIKTIINEIEWENVAFKSTNGALNLRFDLIERAIGSKFAGKEIQ